MQTRESVGEGVARAQLYRIFLNGFMGTGKSTVGRLIAGRRGQPDSFLDVDEQIERAAGTSIRAIFEEAGVDAFRARERDAVRTAINGDATIIALGGGALLDPATQQLVEESGIVVTLTATPQEIDRRIGVDRARPLLFHAEPGADRQNIIAEKLSGRVRIYTPYPCVATDGIDAETIAERVEQIAAAGMTFEVRVGPGATTQIVFGSGPLDSKRCVIITDETVAAIHSDRIQAMAVASPESGIITVPPGEEAKSLDSYRRLCRELLERGVERDWMLIGVGGGVICDLAGFVAATYMRGIVFISIPTTLLAQVDAAIGGKTGIDLDGAKNLLGAFHPARRVVIDSNFLETQSEYGLRQGLAEIAKIAFATDASLVQLLDSLNDSREITSRPDIIRAAVRAKVLVVNQDPFERDGTRALLNFGHTIGHAIEGLSEYRLSHGECVAVGAALEARIAQKLGFVDAGTVNQLTATLARFGLPTSLPDTQTREPAANSGAKPRRFGLDRLMSAMHHDKKAVGGAIRMVMLSGTGRSELKTVSDDDVRAFLEEEPGVER